MPASSLLTITDGVAPVVVPSCSMYSGSIGRAEIGSGLGEIEYADGHAALWVRFERRVLTISGNGPIPHGLYALSLSVASWSVTVDSFANDRTTESWTVIPARPVDIRDVNTGRTSWTLELRSAVAV